MKKRLNNHEDYEWKCFEKGRLHDLHERNCQNLDYAINAYPDFPRRKVTRWVTGSGLRLAAGFNDEAYFENLSWLAHLLAQDGFTAGILGRDSRRQLLDDIDVVQAERERMNQLVALSEELGATSTNDFLEEAKKRKINDPSRLLIWIERAERVNVVGDIIRPGAASGYGPSGIPLLQWKGDSRRRFESGLYESVTRDVKKYTPKARTLISSLTDEQRTVYEQFAASLEQGEWFGIDGQWEYGYIYVASLLRSDLHDLVKLRKKLTTIRELYPHTELGNHAGRTLAETYLLDRDYKSYYECLFDFGVMSAAEFVLSSEIIDRQPSLSELLRWDQKSGFLTPAFGHRFDEATVEVERALKLKFQDPDSLKDYLVSNSNQAFGAHASTGRDFPPDYHIYLFPDEPAAFQVVETSHISRAYGTYGYVVSEMLRELYRDAENILRERDGIPLVGQGWVNETLLFKLVRDTFPEHKVIHQGKPSWLGRQSLDIYFPDLNIGIEYQGIQHYEPVLLFGGEEGLAATQARDAIKRELCNEFGCELLEVREGYNPEQFINKLKKVVDERSASD